jgi:hypothetical protein
MTSKMGQNEQKWPYLLGNTMARDESKDKVDRKDPTNKTRQVTALIETSKIYLQDK